VGWADGLAIQVAIGGTTKSPMTGLANHSDNSPAAAMVAVDTVATVAVVDAVAVVAAVDAVAAVDTVAAVDAVDTVDAVDAVATK